MKIFFNTLLLCLSICLSAPTLAMAQEREQLVNIRHGQLHVVQAGTGSHTVIFESGFMTDLSTWRKVAPAIANHAQVLLYSRAGIGKSPAREQALTLSQHAEELMQLITATNIKGPVILVGHSYGGFVIRQFAATYPAQVAGLVLVDPAMEALEVELKKIDATQVQQDQQRLASLAPPSAKADLALVQAIFDQARLPASAALPDVPGLLLTSIQARKQNPFFQETAPALQVKRDLHAKFFQQFSNGAHLVTNRSGHHIQMEEPHLVIAAIEQVIALLNKEAEQKARQLAKQKARAMMQQAIEKAAAALSQNQTEEAGKIVYAGLKSSQFSEAEINQLGFQLMLKAKQAVLAEMVLKFNTEQFPLSDNAFDSHGEALLELQRPEAAKTQFLTALALAKASLQRSPKIIRAYEENLQKAEQSIAKK